eukprot:TRINITY_DN5195_c2_g1_i1.p1 TRINITY_DN5195_c2_g1~~TRINITY_DN5195_c2_g1_i1.p1  ORF type:complete len:485 (+),score=204.88 TRINITY_DN5195_c2_g1_i1:127-1581(+)
MPKKKKTDFDPRAISPPLILTRCAGYILRNGLTKEGIFRSGGLYSEMQELKKLFEKGGDPTFDGIDPLSVANLITQWLTELDEPLFTKQLYRDFVDTQKIVDEESRRIAICQHLSRLPVGSKCCLQILMHLLTQIESKKDVNLMNSGAIAIVLGPSVVGFKFGSSAITGHLDIKYCISLLEYLIQNHSFFKAFYDTPQSASLLAQCLSPRESPNTNSTISNSNNSITTTTTTTTTTAAITTTTNSTTNTTINNNNSSNTNSTNISIASNLSGNPAALSREISNAKQSKKGGLFSRKTDKKLDKIDKPTDKTDKSTDKIEKIDKIENFQSSKKSGKNWDDPEISIVREDHETIASLNAVLQDKEAGEAFMRYLSEKELSDENLRFYYDTQKYEILETAEERSQFINKMLKQFISEDADCQVNIDGDCRIAIETAVEEYKNDSSIGLSSNLLKEAQRFIFCLIDEHSFPRFLQSTYCRTYLKKKLG